MNEFCFVDSPIGVIELEAESNFISRIKFKEDNSLQLCKESKQNSESPILVKASKQINEFIFIDKLHLKIKEKINQLD